MHHFIDFLKLNVLMAIPQTFIYFLFCFSFLTKSPPKIIQRLLLFAVLHSLYTDTLILVLPVSLHLINSLLAAFLLMYIIFRDLSSRKKNFLLIFSLLFSLAMDLILAAIAFYVLGIPSHEDMLRDHLFQTISILYPQLIITFIASWFVRKKNMYAVKRIFAAIMEVEHKMLLRVASLIVLQFMLLGATQFIQIISDSYNPIASIILIYLTIFVSILALVSIIRLLVRTREQAARMAQDVYVEEINDMFTSIRGQRHDFLNHVQVIHTMVQMGKTEQLKSYVADLVKETRDVSEIVHHSSPALAALVQAKMTVAIGKGIDFTYELPNSWNVDDPTIKVIDIIKIMGNLLDNAFDESALLTPEQRQVHARISITEQQIELEVSNRGRAFDPAEKERIFFPGYTTKGTGHSGLGLAIVLERATHYKGKVEVHSDPHSETTRFQVTLPQSPV